MVELMKGIAAIAHIKFKHFSYTAVKASVVLYIGQCYVPHSSGQASQKYQVNEGICKHGHVNPQRLKHIRGFRNTSVAYRDIIRCIQTEPTITIHLSIIPLCVFRYESRLSARIFFFNSACHLCLGTSKASFHYTKWQSLCHGPKDKSNGLCRALNVMNSLFETQSR